MEDHCPSSDCRAVHPRVLYFGTLRRTRACVASVRAAWSLRCALHVASARLFLHLHRRTLLVLCCILHPCLSHRRALRDDVASTCCIGACSALHRCVLHVACCKRAAVPQRAVVRSVVQCLLRVRCSIGRRTGFAVAERRRDALVCSRTVAAACSPWPAAPRCSTPWRYPTPKQRCVRGGPDAQLGRVSSDCNRRGCAGCA